MQAANDLRFHLGWAAQVCNAAKALPNLINPFWMLPLLGVPGLRARDIVGFTFLQLSGAYPAGSGVAVGAGVDAHVCAAGDVVRQGFFRSRIAASDRKSVGWGKRVSVRVDLVGCR